MTQPQRIQLSRAKGWRMPANTVKVDRTTKFGNPFTAKAARVIGYKGTDADLARMCVDGFRLWLTRPHAQDFWQGDTSEAARDAILTALDRLRGKNLACWCKPGSPCHAEILLELANSEATP